MTQLELQDEAGDPVALTYVDTAAVKSLAAATITSPKVPVLTDGPQSLSYPVGSLIFDDVPFTDQLDVGFHDPNGCRPILAFTISRHGNRSSHTGCFPGLNDHVTAGRYSNQIGWKATLPDGADFDLEMAAVASTDCASIDDPAALMTNPTAVANNPVTLPVTIAPPPDSGNGSGSDTCPGGLLVSTLACSPLGNGGASPYCLTAAEYTGATGNPLPAACFPSGTTGCQSESGPTAGVLVKPCCPGLTCRIGSACGDATATVGGTCLP